MTQLYKTFADNIVTISFLALFGLAVIYLLIDWIFGSRCPKCKKRGVKKISEVCLEDDSDTSTSKQYFVSYKCEKCGYCSYDNESKGNISSS